MSYEKKRKAHARHTTYMRRYFTRCRLVVNSLSACLSLLWACRITGYVKLRFPKFAWIVFSAGFCGGGFDSLVYLYININIYIFILMYRYIYLYIIIYIYIIARVRACMRACTCVCARELFWWFGNWKPMCDFIFCGIIPNPSTVIVFLHFTKK